MKSVKKLMTLFISLSLGISVGWCSVSGEGAKKSALIEYSADAHVAKFAPSNVNNILDYDDDIFLNNEMVNIPVIVSGRDCFVIVDYSLADSHVEQMNCRRRRYF